VTYPLQFERLEPRTMVASTTIAVNLLDVPYDTVEVGQSFYVEITAKESHPLAAGLGGVALDIDWDPQVLNEISEPFDPRDPDLLLVTSDFPIFRNGTLDNEAGEIRNLAGAAFLASGIGRAIGAVHPERFALLEFHAKRTGTTVIEIGEGRSGIVPVPAFGLRDDILFERREVLVVPPLSVPYSLTDAEVAWEVASERPPLEHYGPRETTK